MHLNNKLNNLKWPVGLSYHQRPRGAEGLHYIIDMPCTSALGTTQHGTHISRAFAVRFLMHNEIIK